MTIVFVMECIYGTLITGIPFLIMIAMNSMILKTLLRTGRLRRNQSISLNGNGLGTFSLRQVSSRNASCLRAEFTLILLGVSTCFICLNLPYFVYWCCFMAEELKRIASDNTTNDNPVYQNELLITKTLFSCNYCVNFFLYCFSGSYYKKELRKLFYKICPFRLRICCQDQSRTQNGHYVSTTDHMTRISQL